MQLQLAIMGGEAVYDNVKLASDPVSDNNVHSDYDTPAVKYAHYTN